MNSNICDDILYSNLSKIYFRYNIQYQVLLIYGNNKKKKGLVGNKRAFMKKHKRVYHFFHKRVYLVQK